MRANTPDPACMLIVVGGRQVAASKESQQCVLESTLGNSIDKRVGKRSRSVAQRYLSRPIANCGCTTLSCNNLTSSQPTCQKSYVRFAWLQDIYATWLPILIAGHGAILTQGRRKHSTFSSLAYVTSKQACLPIPDVKPQQPPQLHKPTY